MKYTLFLVLGLCSVNTIMYGAEKQPDSAARTQPPALDAVEDRVYKIATCTLCGEVKAVYSPFHDGGDVLVCNECDGTRLSPGAGRDFRSGGKREKDRQRKDKDQKSRRKDGKRK